MDEERALLQAIREGHPGDDTPRLVYADWLDEHGRHDHAAATREDVELERTAPDAGDPVDPDWAGRVDAHVLSVNESIGSWFGEDLGRWLNGAKGTWRPTVRRAGFDRGMLVLKGAPFQLAQAVPMLGLKQYVTGIAVTGPQGGYGDLAEAVEGLRATSLSFDSHNQYVQRVLEAFLGENGRMRGHAMDSLVRIDLGDGVHNYHLSDLARWGERERLEEITVGPGQVGSDLSRWADPLERSRLIDYLYDLSSNRVGIQPWQRHSKEVLKIIRYRSKIRWRP